MLLRHSRSSALRKSTLIAEDIAGTGMRLRIGDAAETDVTCLRVDDQVVAVSRSSSSCPPARPIRRGCRRRSRRRTRRPGGRASPKSFSWIRRRASTTHAPLLVNRARRIADLGSADFLVGRDTHSEELLQLAGPSERSSVAGPTASRIAARTPAKNRCDRRAAALRVDELEIGGELPRVVGRRFRDAKEFVRDHGRWDRRRPPRRRGRRRGRASRRREPHEGSGARRSSRRPGSTHTRRGPSHREPRVDQDGRLVSRASWLPSRFRGTASGTVTRTTSPSEISESTTVFSRCDRIAAMNSGSRASGSTTVSEVTVVRATRRGLDDDPEASRLDRGPEVSRGPVGESSAITAGVLARRRLQDRGSRDQDRSACRVVGRSRQNLLQVLVSPDRDRGLLIQASEPARSGVGL